jgi:limonene 1,2-monooxygenase
MTDLRLASAVEASVMINAGLMAATGRPEAVMSEKLDRLGFDEVWFGEHHSGGSELVASPELLIAAAAERTTRVSLGTDVVSLPYHHPFQVAERMVQLTHLTAISPYA